MKNNENSLLTTLAIIVIGFFILSFLWKIFIFFARIAFFLFLAYLVFNYFNKPKNSGY